MEKQYLKILEHIKRFGSKRMDRTGTGTKAIFGPQMEHDLSLGEFPLLTTKKTFLRGITEELFWLLNGDTNIQYLNDRNVSIWDEWALTEEQAQGTYRKGDLGPIYGAAWRRVPNIRRNQFVLVKVPDVKAESVQVDVDCEEMLAVRRMVMGVHHEQYNCNVPFRIIDHEVVDDRTILMIQFHHTKEVRRIPLKDLQEHKFIPCSEKFDVFGAANCDIPEDEICWPLYHAWYRMIEICYGKGAVRSGGRYVCEKWLTFSGFCEDVSRLPLYEEWQMDPENFYLSCDYKGTLCFSVDSTVFAPIEYMGKWFGKGDTLYIEKDHNLNPTGRRSLTAEADTAYEKKAAPEGYVWRQSLYIDQFEDTMKSLANKAGSRRHLVSAWIPQYLPDESISPQENVLNGRAALATCHCLFQFFVEDMEAKDRLYYYEVRQEDRESAIVWNNFTEEAIHKRLDRMGFPRQRLSCKLYQRS